MRYIILFLCLTLTVEAQDLLLLSGDEFNPLKYDAANLIALYDGDASLSTSAWNDQSGNGYNMTLVNAPDITNKLNGHGTVLFNGNDEHGVNASAILTAQPFTVYMVLKQVTLTDNDRVFASQGTDQFYLRQEATSPTANSIAMYAGTTTLYNNGIAVGSFGVLTAVYNGASSGIRTNLGTIVSGNAGAGVSTGGFFLATRGTVFWSNIQVAYLIIRNGADDTATQNKFIGFLQKRFGL